MVFLRQFLVILGFSFLGEALHALLPLPIPASVYGLVLLFLALCLGVVKPEKVKGAAGFLLEIMPVLFIPALVGLLDVWPLVEPILLPALVIAGVSTLVTMGVTGKAAQWVLRRKEGKDRE